MESSWKVGFSILSFHFWGFRELDNCYDYDVWVIWYIKSWISLVSLQLPFISNSKGLLTSLLSEVLIKITELTLSRSLVTVVWMFVVGNNQWSVSVQLFMRAQLCQSCVLIVWLCWLVIPTSVVCCCWQVSFTTTALSHLL